MTIKLLLLLTIFLLGSAQSSLGVADSLVPLDAEITLSDMGVRVKISANGLVSVDGQSFESDISQIRLTIGADELQNLISEFGRINYFALQDRYCGTEDGCPKATISCPGYAVRTSLRLNGRSKSITHCASCVDLDGGEHPRELSALEDHIRAAINLNRRRSSSDAMRVTSASLPTSP